MSTMESMGILQAEEPVVAAPASAQAPQEHLTHLAGYIRRKFELAQTARMPVEREMIEDLRNMRSMYSPAKLAAIYEAQQMRNPPFIGITEAKCDSSYAWLIDYLLPPGKFPAKLEPTPVPELPAEIKAEIEDRIHTELLQRLEQVILSGTPITADQVRATYQEMTKQAKKEIDKEILEQARESAERLFNEIKDQFAEGGWEDAFREALHDLVAGTAIMRGPVLRSMPKRIRQLDLTTRKFKTIYAHDIIPTWDRLVPLRFYPAPEATRKSVPWHVYVNATSRKDLADLLDDDSFDQLAVRAALDEYGNGHREATSVESDKTALENRTVTDNEGLIDRIEYGGSIPGKLLGEWGIDGLDPQREYEAQVWMIGSHVLKAVLNPDPVGLNYIFSAGFTEQPDSFWGAGIPRKMRHVQNICNTAARAIMKNMGVASGPIMEYNVDRMWQWTGVNFAIKPWMAIPSTTSMLQEGKAVNFYQANMVTARLIEVFQWGEDVADRVTGFPRVLYSGESRTPTATANTQLVNNAAKGAMAVVSNVDRGLVIPMVQAAVAYTLQYESDDVDYVGDVRVVAMGSNSMVAAAEKATRIKELLSESSVNPVDAQVFTVEVRTELWREAINALGLDSSILGDEDEIEERTRKFELQQMLAQAPGRLPAGAGMSPGAPSPAPAQLDGAGNEVAGREAQMYETPAGVTP